MFDAVRNNAKLLQFILLLLIFPAFAFFGVSGYQRFMSNEGIVASVDGEPITRADFDRVLQRQVESMRQMMGGNVDAKLIDSPAMRRELLDQMINERVMTRLASERHIRVSDEQLREQLMQMAQLRGTDGKFDMARYRQLLAANGLNEVVFEAQMRRDMSAQVVPEAVSQTVFVPKSVLEQVGKIMEQVREVAEAKYGAEAFAAQVKPTDEQLKAYYEANSARYQNPESAKVELIELDTDALAAKIAVNADDVKTYYDSNQKKYLDPEQRRARHVLIKADKEMTAENRAKARTKADQLAGELAKPGADFAAIAKAESQDPGSAEQGGDLGFFSAGDMVKPFSDAVFGAKIGDVTGVVESDFGFHVIKLEEIKPARQRSFEEVRADIEDEQKKTQAAAKYAEAAETLSNKVEDSSDSLQAAADALQLKIRVVEGMNRRGLPSEAPNAVVNNEKLLAALFSEASIKTKRNTAAIEVAPRHMVAARLIDYKPAQAKPFDEVKNDVSRDYTAQESVKLAIAAGQARLKALQAGNADAPADAPSFGAPIKVSRASSSSLPSPAIDPIFAADPTKLPAYVGSEVGVQGYSVFRIDSVSDGSGTEEAKKRTDGMRQGLARALGQQEVMALLEASKARMKIERFDDRVLKQDSTNK